MKVWKATILRLRPKLLLAAGGFLLALASAGHAQSREHLVTNLQDAGPGSLRQTIAEAEAGDRIRFGVAGTLLLESSLVVDKDLEIDGEGQVTLSGQAKTGILEMNGGEVRLLGLAFVDGKRSSGGAIHQVDGQLTLEDCRLEGNRADRGGAIFIIDNRGDAKIPSTVIGRTRVIDNAATSYGGGIGTSAPLIVEDSQFHRNRAESSGGALTASRSLEIQRSIFTGNEAGTRGAAILTTTDVLQRIVNSLIAENLVSHASPGTSAGAIASDSNLRLIHSTVAFNRSIGSNQGGGISTWPNLDSDEHTRLLNSLIAHNTPRNCSGNIVDDGGNLQFPGDQCGEDLPQADPQLSPVRDAIGDLIALLPAESGPAVDTAPSGPCLGAPVLAVDARGFPRPVAGRPGQVGACDIGAFELGPATTPTPGYRPDNTPTPEPADLLVRPIHWGYLDPGNCANFGPIIVDLEVNNAGASDTGPFWLEVGGERFRIANLPAGRYWNLRIDQVVYAPRMAVDPENEVRERLEGNNLSRQGLPPFLAAGADRQFGRPAIQTPAEVPGRRRTLGSKSPLGSIPQRTEPPRCTHTPTPPASPSQTPTPTATRLPANWSLPDPFFDDIIWTKACPTGQRLIQPCLAWRGPQPVGAVRVGSEPPGLVWDIDLAAGPACGEPKAVLAGLTALLIDPDRRMNERSEDNNRRAVPPPDFWMPSLCTPTPTVSPTATPSPTPTASRTPWPTSTPRVSPSPTSTESLTPRPQGSRLWLPLLRTETGAEVLLDSAPAPGSR